MTDLEQLVSLSTDNVTKETSVSCSQGRVLSQLEQRWKLQLSCWKEYEVPFLESFFPRIGSMVGRQMIKPRGLIFFLPSIPHFHERHNYSFWRFLCSGTVPYTVLERSRLSMTACSSSHQRVGENHSQVVKGGQRERERLFMVCICLFFKTHLNHVCTLSRIFHSAS